MRVFKTVSKNVRFMTINSCLGVLIVCLQMGFWNSIALAQSVQSREIAFFGCLVDQDGEPVTEAVVHVELRADSSKNAETVTETIRTDANGRFELNGKGEIVHILGIEKKG
ncbi:MAG: hypothetical protein JXA82_15855 [Sedimentisphaerales bacterium]|nr:hypothetical protein [Sedimentisphaerales bacterium]